MWMCNDVLGAIEIYISCALSVPVLIDGCQLPSCTSVTVVVGCPPPSVVAFCFRCPRVLRVPGALHNAQLSTGQKLNLGKDLHMHVFCFVCGFFLLLPFAPLLHRKVRVCVRVPFPVWTRNRVSFIFFNPSSSSSSLWVLHLG